MAAKVISIATRKRFKQLKNTPEFRDQQVVESLQEALTYAERGHLQSVMVLGWNPNSQSFMTFAVDPNRAMMMAPGARFSTALRELASLYMNIGAPDIVDMVMRGAPTENDEDDDPEDFAG